MEKIRLDYAYPGRTQGIKDDLRALFEVEVTELPSGTRIGRIFYVKMRDPDNLHRLVYVKVMVEFRDRAAFYAGRRFGIETDLDRECPQGVFNAVLGDASDGCDQIIEAKGKLDQWLEARRVDVH